MIDLGGINDIDFVGMCIPFLFSSGKKRMKFMLRRTRFVCG